MFYTNVSAVYASVNKREPFLWGNRWHKHSPNSVWPITELVRPPFTFCACSSLGTLSNSVGTGNIHNLVYTFVYNVTRETNARNQLNQNKWWKRVSIYPENTLVTRWYWKRIAKVGLARHLATLFICQVPLHYQKDKIEYCLKYDYTIPIYIQCGTYLYLIPWCWAVGLKSLCITAKGGSFKYLLC